MVTAEKTEHMCGSRANEQNRRGLRKLGLRRLHKKNMKQDKTTDPTK